MNSENHFILKEEKKALNKKIKFFFEESPQQFGKIMTNLD